MSGGCFFASRNRNGVSLVGFSLDWYEIVITRRDIVPIRDGTECMSDRDNNELVR